MMRYTHYFSLYATLHTFLDTDIYTCTIFFCFVALSYLQPCSFYEKYVISQITVIQCVETMNYIVTVWPFSGSESRDAFQLLERYRCR